MVASSVKFTMEEEMSMISNAITNVSWEASDSNSSNYPFSTKKRPRQDSSVSASRFKGVVCQQNGHWGAQLYANHQRIWLGTFKSEKEAAMAYDSAAIKLRSGDSHRNFPWTNITVQEPNFQSQFNTDAVLNMIKDGSYQSKFEDFLRMQFQRGEIEFGLSLLPEHANGDGGFLCRLLFQKELTPSDVGKLNRLVIPKKYALKYFPHISEGAEEIVASGGVDDMQLVFHDRLMRSWKFRYCYWKSSQSFVFTRGWNRFVKEKELKEKDMVIFSLCECKDGSNEFQTFCMIDVSYNDGVESNGGVVEDINEGAGMQGALQLDMGQHGGGEDEEEFEKATLQLHLGRNSPDGEDEKEFEEERELVSIESANAERKVLRLFGVEII
ncbi:hypothetical protein F0562_030341 [Nyssa sinensis]|uniref:TF-B3 domain-containing protein n=1 Tax=Nyssa sinensis TaxID=561372 RepID=A0A5J5AYL2_9ASTE|nr:hypothetical protein F0562_030341 [Nyssa sinensis]